MNRSEVAQALGCSEKTVSRYIAAGKLVPKSRVRGGAVDIDAADVEALRQELEEQAGQGTGQGDTALAVSRPAPTASKGLSQEEALSLLVSVATEATTTAIIKATHEASGKPSEVAFKTILTIEETHTLTRFSLGRIKAAIKDGTLKAGKIGRGWVIRRSNLDAWTENLF